MAALEIEGYCQIRQGIRRMVYPASIVRVIPVSHGSLALQPSIS